jgi:Tfp pilus assembly protein PilF
VDLILRRIGDLAAKFLLSGDFERARACAEDALAKIPNSVVFNLTHAHAMMFLGLVEDARTIYASYRRKSNRARILKTFAELRQAGRSHPLMDEVEAWFVGARTAPPSEPSKCLLEVVEPPIEKTEAPAAAPRRENLELGDRSRDEGKLAEAYKHYFRDLMACRLRLLRDSTDPQAQEDLDLLVPRIGDLAFDFLLSRDTKRASEAIGQALRDRPNWLRLHLIHAHVLILTSNISEARRLHTKHFLDPLEDGEIWGHAIRDDFARLRKAGYKLPIIDAFEREYAPPKK